MFDQLKKHILGNKQGFVRNISILTLCNILVCVTNLFINMYLARTLRPEGYGEYGVIISVSGILMTISSLGVHQVVIRRISQQQEDSAFHYKISIIARLIGYFTIIIPYIFYYVFWGDMSMDMLFLIVANVLMLSLWDGIQNLAFGMQRMEYTGYINIVGTTILLVLYLVIPVKNLSLFVVVFFLVLVSAIKNYVYFYKCKQQGLLTYSNNMSIVKSDIINVIKESFPYYWLAVLTLFSTQWPIIFLANHSGLDEVAFFNSANKIMVPTSIALTSIMSALLPNLSKEIKSDYTRFASKVNSMIRFLVLSGIFCSFSIALFRDEIVILVFGDDYKTTGDVLLSQCWYLVFHAVFALIGNVLTAADKPKTIVYLSLFYAIVNTLIFWPASFHGAVILSYGVILGCFINIIYHFYFFKKDIKGIVSNKEAIMLLCVSSLCISLSLLFHSNISLFVRILIWVFLLILIYTSKTILLKYVDYRGTK